MFIANIQTNKNKEEKAFSNRSDAKEYLLRKISELVGGKESLLYENDISLRSEALREEYLQAERDILSFGEAFVNSSTYFYIEPPIFIYK